MQRATTFWVLAAGVLAFALVLRVGAALWWQSRLPDSAAFAFPDSESYWSLARTVAGGQTYEFGPGRRVFRSPGYPATLAGLFCVRADPPVVWGRLVGAALGTAAVGAVMLLARQLFDRNNALIAGLLAALYPGAVAMSILILSEAAFCVWILLQLILWTAAWRYGAGRPAVALGAAAGAAAGVATLVRPDWLLFTPLACLACLCVARPRRRAIVVGASVLLGLLVTMAPWWIRNARVTGRFVPTTLQSGASLYDGLSPDADGASDMRFVARFACEQRRADAETWAAGRRPDSTFEYRLDRRMRRAAADWATGNPAAAARLIPTKLARTWNVWPNDPALRGTAFRAVVAVGYVPLVLFGLIGAWRFGRRGWPYVLCVLPAVYASILHAVFVGSIRYRQPAMLVLTVLAAGAAAAVFAGVGKRERGD